jgi:hypothetical protein
MKVMLQALWNPTETRSLDKVARWVDELKTKPTEGARQMMDENVLMKVCRLSARKAGGADGRNAKQMARLPINFFTALAYLWGKILDGGSISKKITVRMVGRLKPDGTERALGIAAHCYRLGMTMIMKGITPWANAWLADELVGVTAGREARWAHVGIEHAVCSAFEKLPQLTGGKLDIKKCFDTVCPWQAIVILRRTGCHSSVLWMLTVFFR